MTRAFALIAAAVLLAFSSAGQTASNWDKLNHEAGAAIRAKDYAKLRTALTAMEPLTSGVAVLRYNEAAADAVLGKAPQALQELMRLAESGVVFDYNADQDLASVQRLPGWPKLISANQANRKPIALAQPAFALTETDLLPEDIAYDRAAKRFYVGSVRKSKIVTASGETFAKTPWPVLALRIDENRGLLWAACGWVPHCEDCAATDKDKTALLAFDLRSAELKQRIDSPVPGLFGDMTIGVKGDLYISEGIHGAVFHLAPGGSALDRLDAVGEFPSPQTPALSADERTLYVADYARGIAAIDLQSKETKWVQAAPNIVVNGIDGLYRWKNSFIAVQNGTNPARVILLSLDLQRQKVLEANSAGLGEPTHGVLVGDDFYFLANTGWSAYDDNGKKKTDAAAIASTVRKIDLRKIAMP